MFSIERPDLDLFRTGNTLLIIEKALLFSDAFWDKVDILHQEVGTYNPKQLTH